VSLLSVKRTCAYIISLLVLIPTGVMAQKPEATEPPDSVFIPLAIRAGIDIAGPVIYLTDKSNLTIEGYLSADLNEKRSLFLGGGYSNYKYSQYNYSYLTKGIFLRTGVDFNLLKPQTSMGKYWAGIGLHYCISTFKYQIPELSHENYWGTTSISLPSQLHWGHFIEATPGFRAQLFSNFTIGWSISLRKMIYSGGSKDTRPIYIPGYGQSAKSFSFGINYFLIWNFRYKTIRVLIQKEPPEEPEETETPADNTGSGNMQNMEP
jgi:hypothetical protein